MTSFQMVKYHGQEYPADVPLIIEEIAAHFDVTKIGGKLDKSLHTEYSYGIRKWDSVLIRKYPELIAAQKDGVPQLWKNVQWADQFTDFIVELNGCSSAPKVIEIHPPFTDYTDISGFIISYSVFERKIKGMFPDIEILIENRCGSVYQGGRFVVSKIKDIEMLCDAVEKAGLQLRIAFDVPQIYTAHNARTEKEFLNLIEMAKQFREMIGGVHLWGKRMSSTGRKVSHCGDLNTYFCDRAIKEHFLSAFKECFDDNTVRKMVLEVNSGNEDLQSIISDLRSVGVRFV